MENIENKPKKEKKSAFDKIMTLIMTTICLVVAILIARNLLTNKKQDLAITTTETSSAINVEVESASYSNLTQYTKIYGDIITDSEPVAIYPDVSGKITSLTVKKGDRVEKGDTIGYVDQTKPGYSYQQSPITSTISGEVLSVDIAIGDTVQSTTSIITVKADEELKIKAKVPERYIGVLSLGNVSDFTVAAYPDNTYSAELTYLSPIVDTSTRTAEIELTIVGEQTGLLKGMFAVVNLVTESIENIITVPVSAIGNDNNGSYVLVVENNTAVKKEVTTGLSDGNRIALEAGLNENDLVIISGSANEGSSVSIVEGNK